MKSGCLGGGSCAEMDVNSLSSRGPEQGSPAPEMNSTLGNNPKDPSFPSKQENTNNYHFHILYYSPAMLIMYQQCDLGQVINHSNLTAIAQQQQGLHTSQPCYENYT